MDAELIISIISLVTSFIAGIFTAIITFKVGKFEHLEKIKTYEKNITNFELQFKDERWLAEIMENGEFDHYNLKSKKRIFCWWEEYKKDHIPVLLTVQVDYAKLNKINPSNRGLGIDRAKRVSQIGAGGQSVNFIMPGDDDIPDPADLF